MNYFGYNASNMDNYIKEFSKRNIVVIGGIICYTLWLIYNIYVRSYSGIIADAVIIISLKIINYIL